MKKYNIEDLIETFVEYIPKIYEELTKINLNKKEPNKLKSENNISELEKMFNSIRGGKNKENHKKVLKLIYDANGPISLTNIIEKYGRREHKPEVWSSIRYLKENSFIKKTKHGIYQISEK